MTFRSFYLALLVSAVLALQSSAARPTPFLTGQGHPVSFRTFEDDAGGFYLVWSDAGRAKLATLRAQHINPQGRTVWEDGGIVVSSELFSAEDWSGLADGRGGLTLFWDEPDGVHAQRFGSEGARLRGGNSVRLSTSTAIQPDAVPDAAGGTLVVWKQLLPGGGRSVLIAQRLDTEGRPVWPAGGIRVSLRASNQTNPRVVYDNMSGMIVAWRDDANSASELRIQRIDFQGNRLWTLEGLKITAPVGLTEFPIIAPTGTGEVVLAWNGQSGQTNQIFLQNVGPRPVLKWGNMTLASNVPVQFNRWNPALLGDENGGTWIAWEDFHDQNNYQIQLNHLDGAGKSVWPKGEISVAPAPGDQGKLTMAGTEKEGIWLAWIDNRLSTIGLYVQEIDPSGQRLQGSRGRLIADGLSKPSKPQLITLAPGIAAVAWVNRPKKDQWELYWSIMGNPL